VINGFKWRLLRISYDIKSPNGASSQMKLPPYSTANISIIDSKMTDLCETAFEHYVVFVPFKNCEINTTSMEAVKTCKVKEH
jgi:hypothetical protein